ncbi:hypothetical protein VCSRO2_3550 [Vibrio cholerae]|nr:hypothetical protein Sa5Y_VCA03144 [Vibrio cholerae]EGR5013406.1 hypothetical protein [Vibrio cholerae]KFE25274.1 hypothetical protein DN30_4097 [Vibrio cholerae]GHX02355.1 hypothetical protein VCSRO105_3739 [Vibrio cholerae]GHX02875.1 hypothetical protein VCSRO2_3550 [Vibrio cholerae]
MAETLHHVLSYLLLLPFFFAKQHKDIFNSYKPQYILGQAKAFEHCLLLFYRSYIFYLKIYEHRLFNLLDNDVSDLILANIALYILFFMLMKFSNNSK